jgi:hypothetical protein
VKYSKRRPKSETSPGGSAWIVARCDCSHERVSRRQFMSDCERDGCGCGAFAARKARRAA